MASSIGEKKSISIIVLLFYLSFELVIFLHVDFGILVSLFLEMGPTRKRQLAHLLKSNKIKDRHFLFVIIIGFGEGGGLAIRFKRH